MATLWRVCAQDLEKQLGYLPGDCLIAAAFLSYMGPFLSYYREAIVRKVWMVEVSSPDHALSPPYIGAEAKRLLC